MSSQNLIFVTAASGQLGRLVIKHLLQKGVPANHIIAGVRTPDKVADLREIGIQVRHADFADIQSLKTAFEGVQSILLISSDNLRGNRIDEHRNWVNAIRSLSKKPSSVVYTSVVNASLGKKLFDEDHIVTENLLQDLNIPYTFLRNGWYNENYIGSILGAVQYGALISAAGDGKISAAAREDYAEAAAVVLANPHDHANKIYELAGDEGVTMTELASYISAASGKTVAFTPLTKEAYAEALRGFGLPTNAAHLLADADESAGTKASLYENSKTLSKLIGHPTRSLKATVELVVNKP
jgi:NAD(P)H dehydrogenase (quinone)